MARDKVSICNNALDELPAENIQSIDDVESVGARACKRHYQPVLSDLLAEWEFEGAIRRQVLVPTSNDRPGEWGFAYAEPSSVASLIRVLPYRDPAIEPEVVVLPGQVLSPNVGYLPQNVGLPFLRNNGKIYTNANGAVLEFATMEPDLGRMTPLFLRAFELELASRICMPVIKSRGRKKELVAEAEVARSRAIADDRNNSPDRYDQIASEEALVRAGLHEYPAPWWNGGNV